MFLTVCYAQISTERVGILLHLFSATCCTNFLFQRAHRPLELTDNQIHGLATLSNTSHIDAVLDTILIPRVVGTKNHKKVRNYIVEELKKLNWQIFIDDFEEVTPTFGKLKFYNVIATRNPEAKRFLVLACHYDSKYTRENNFIGKF